jgi:hypothetical protein
VIIEKKDTIDKRDYNATSRKLDFPIKISLEQGIEEIIGHLKEIGNYKDEKFYNVKILQTL